jgi:alpha-ketoglutarate-dependent taurine dioxygenase
MTQRVTQFNRDESQSTSPGAAGNAQDQWIKTSLQPDQPLPLVIEPAAFDVELGAWARDNLDFIETELLKHGAILFRGFDVPSVPAFEEIITIITPDLVNYIEGSSPRIMVGDRVYTSTEYPPEYFVSMHNELSYAHAWPSRIFFFCLTEPREGGETPIADSRKVLALLDPQLKARFVEKGVKYVRNLHGKQGAGLSWQTVFETTDKAAVEAYCREGDIDFKWKDDGSLWTSQVRPAVIQHPKTGESVWFNQVDQWHPSNLGEEIAKALLAVTNEADLPINAYYGDGTPLDTADLDAIRAAYQQTMITFPWQEGDIMLLDNMLTAHGRMPFVRPRKILVAMGTTVGHKDIAG